MLRKVCIPVLLLLIASWLNQAGAQHDRYDLIVARDGSGDFRTLQEAINAVPDMRKNRTIIFIRNGIYKEKLVIPETKTMVTLIGEQVDSVIITYDDHAATKNIFSEEKGTSGSASCYLTGKDLIAENITFANSSGPVGQAVAAWVAGDRMTFINCRFLGFQDTLYTYGHDSRQYYLRCYIEGTVDFIFGSSTAVFDSCIIYCKKSGYITAASTPENKTYGYVFRYCRVTGDAPDGSFYLGRPWRPFAKTVFMYCELGGMIRAEGWHNWNKKEAEATSWYAEYKNTGPGAAGKRVSWSHRLTDREAAAYTPRLIFAGWEPPR